MKTTDQIIDEIFERVAAKTGDDYHPEEWHTDDRITFGMWREAIREVIDPEVTYRVTERG